MFDFLLCQVDQWTRKTVFLMSTDQLLFIRMFDVRLRSLKSKLIPVDKQSIVLVGVKMDDTKQTRRAFSREFKLSVVQWFYSNNKNVLQTSNHFKIDRKQVRTWVKAEEKIRKQKSKSMSERGRKAISHEWKKS